ncbi:MAG: hypothetical protein IPJ81_04545 [Chitinophagaceae bacterium]|nr:hypothetical protein [Chitinophagaceae bacterium]
MKKIVLEDIQFEPWASTYHVGATYQSKPFTGIAERIEDGIYLKYYYKQGRACGRWYEFNQKTGEVLYDGIFENATAIGEHKINDSDFKRIVYYDEGGSSLLEKKWNPQGILIKHFDKAEKINEEYYNDGSLYLICKELNGRIHRFYYLGKKSLWLLKDSKFDSRRGNILHQFNDKLFKERFDELISSFHLQIVDWYIKHLIETNKRQAFAFIKKCLGHLDPLFQIIAVKHSANLNNPALIPCLEKLNSRTELCSDLGSNCVMCYGSLHSASKKAIRFIRKNMKGKK